MRLNLLLFPIFFFTFSFCQELSNLPKPSNEFVCDQANLLSESDRLALNNKLKHYADSAEINIFVVSAVLNDDQKIEKITNKIFTSWQLEENKNILVVVTKGHHMFIKTSQSLKSSISSLTCNQIVLYTLMPSFKNKHFLEGLELAAAQLIGDTSGEYKEKYEKGNTSSALLLALMIFFIIFVLVPFAKYKMLQNNQVDGKPLNFFTAMLLMNLLGGKKGSFSDFSNGKGQFGSFGAANGGGGGSGNW